ncbi:MAG: phosphate acetyltransferase [Enterobacteriaceae bacterium PC38]|nr:MAG: phosphate acetyltransferase [Enterobacteriaceae bacterium PC38]
MSIMIMFLLIKNNILNNIILNIINSIKKNKICYIKPTIKINKKNIIIKKNIKIKKFEKNILINELISYYQKNINKYDIFIIKGLYLQNYIFLNYEISKNLNIVNLINFFLNFKNFNNYIIENKKKKKKKIIFKNKKKTSKQFIYKITELSKKSNKRIILPEGYEPRIIKAASICYKKKIAKCILLGNPNKIKKIALLNNINLNKNIEIIDPKKIRNNYINKLIELRKHKGMDEYKAIKALKDNIILATMMLKQNEVDGLLSGSINTTANTIRPALQIIKTSNNVSLISSIFFMLLPENVLIYGDCAININPNAEQLAEIAIESAKSALLFDIKPKIAMISYSTGNSSKGKDVEKIIKATNLVKKKRPDLLIEGPLQYDAAINSEISKLKLPFSKIKGKSNIIIFPNLNTGNTTYKAVQRHTNIISIGPILQGIKKPVNDLSRGATINDIIYTIAITSIQASKKK